MEINSVVHLHGRKGRAVEVTFGTHLVGVNIRLDYGDTVTTFTTEHLADVLSALVLGEQHIDGLPEYCQCEACREKRGKAFAARLAEAQVERLRAIEEQRQEGCQ